MFKELPYLEWHVNIESLIFRLVQSYFPKANRGLTNWDLNICWAHYRHWVNTCSLTNDDIFGCDVWLMGLNLTLIYHLELLVVDDRQLFQRTRVTSKNKANLEALIWFQTIFLLLFHLCMLYFLCVAPILKKKLLPSCHQDVRRHIFSFLQDFINQKCVSRSNCTQGEGIT